ncbi:hypothetical protein [Blastococcus sp. TF02A-35]|uniref:hypothetical protein n=1 Tax=Blastococcus sp. TF02A-35 TaxID=2559612 RepID=UPI0010730A6C|nr:hypothetical protein [Blastococcus sp. TF02A_35]TFV52965.1 hypothetical protein E4P43_03470 [Blastococcus sp. TF02A_35]
MDVLLGLVAVLVPASAIAVVLLPPVVLAVGRRRPLLAAASYVAALTFVAAWVVAAVDHMEWADRTGGQGSAFAGSGWLVPALAAAAGSVVASLRRSPPAPATRA